jgi:hypothetical protein
MRTSRLVLIAATALCSLVLVTGCSGVKQDWSSAQAADTLEAYDAFLGKHADSEFATQAKERVAQLTEERDWELATQADTADSYQKFLALHADGKWSQEARVRVENFNVMNASGPAAPPPVAAPAKPPGDAPTPAVANRPAPAVAATPARAATPAKGAAPVKPEPAAKVPTPAAAADVVKPSAPAKAAGPAAGATTGAVRIQLGALSTEAKARGEWQRLQGKFPALKGLEPQIAAAQTSAGRLFRLQSRVGSEAQAERICATLKAAGQGCMQVPASR